MGSTTDTSDTATSGTDTSRRRPIRVPASEGRRSGRTAAALALSAVIVLGACGGDRDDATAATESVSSPTADGADSSSDLAVEATGDSRAPATGGAAEAGVPIGDFGRDIIRSVGLTMATSNVRETTDDIRRLTAANGGAVFSSDITISDEQDDGSVPGGGQIVVRIPPPDLDRLVTALDGAGIVTRLTQDSDDVTDQLVDLDIRIRQSEAGIGRIEVLLEQASDLDTVFAIENELTQRQVELEQLRAAQRNTEDLVDLATLTVDVEYRSPETIDDVVDVSEDGIGDAFATGWDAFVGAVFAIGFVLAVASPFLLLALGVLAIAWVFGRRWTARSAERREADRRAADRSGTLSSQESPESSPSAPRSWPGASPQPPPPSVSDRRPDVDAAAACVAVERDADSDLSDDVGATPTE